MLTEEELTFVCTVCKCQVYPEFRCRCPDGDATLHPEDWDVIQALQRQKQKKSLN